MRKSLKRFISVLLFAAVITVCFSACQKKDPASYTANNTTFKIGFSGPLSGNAALFGEADKNGAQMAIDEINEAGGLNGIKFELICRDDCHDYRKVKDNFFSLLEDGMQISLGCGTSTPCIEWKKYAQSENVFYLTPSASADECVDSASNGYQMCYANSKQGAVAANYINANYKGKTIGLFYKTDDEYSVDIYNNFKETIDPEVRIIETSFSDANATEFSAQINKLKDCPLIFMPIYYSPASQFMTQAKNIMKRNTIYYCCDGIDGIDKMPDFNINSITQEVSMISLFNMKSTDRISKEYVDKYISLYGKASLTQFSAAAYDSVYVIYQAMKAAADSGKSIDVSITASELCEIVKEQFANGIHFNGITGSDITWDEEGYIHRESVKYVVKQAD